MVRNKIINKFVVYKIVFLFLIAISQKEYQLEIHVQKHTFPLYFS